MEYPTDIFQSSNILEEEIVRADEFLMLVPTLGYLFILIGTQLHFILCRIIGLTFGILIVIKGSSLFTSHTLMIPKQ